MINAIKSQFQTSSNLLILAVLLSIFSISSAFAIELEPDADKLEGRPMSDGEKILLDSETISLVNQHSDQIAKLRDNKRELEGKIKNHEYNLSNEYEKLRIEHSQLITNRRGEIDARITKANDVAINVSNRMKDITVGHEAAVKYYIGLYNERNDIFNTQYTKTKNLMTEEHNKTIAKLSAIDKDETTAAAKISISHPPKTSADYNAAIEGHEVNMAQVLDTNALRADLLPIINIGFVKNL